MPIATVSTTSPLTVTVPGATTAQPATAVSGYSPAAGAKVIYLFEAGRTVVLCPA